MPLKLFDRYVIRLFLRVAIVCFVSTAGLYCVIDAFNNMDELVGLGKQMGGLHIILTDYYGPRIPWFFDRGSALVALIGAMFTVHTLQRSREMTALMAAGISQARVVQPLVGISLIISGLAAANRELVLPQVRERLVRNAQDWMGENAHPVQPTTDNRTDILLNGKSVIGSERRIDQPNFQLYQQYGEFGRYLQAASAYYVPADARHPSGYLFKDVTEPKQPSALASVVVDGQPIILTPCDEKWLESDQLFVVSDVGFDQLAGGSAWRRYSSTLDLIRQLHNPSLDYGLDTRVIVHSRFVQPFLDMTLFFLGLPLVLAREYRNIFLAVGWCFLMVVVFFLVVFGCQALGSSGYLLSPSLAAWFPLMILAPAATMVSYPIWQK